MSYTLPVKIGFYRAKYYREGRQATVRAIVNHRMVGYVAGTRRYFQNPDRPVSTHFGIGFIDGKLTIDQYVPLDDTAFGNGNYDSSGVWDDWGYPTTEINDQTINIEHQDHGDPAGKGVVSEEIQQASIRLQALLLRGSIAEWKAAGIVLRDWTNNGPILQRELNRIIVMGKTIITHNDIAGRLKPYCWKPWADDKFGFPRIKYVAGIQALTAPQPAPVPEDDMRGFTLLEGKAGHLVVKGTGHYYLDVHTDQLVGPLPDGWPGTPKRAYPARLDKPIRPDFVNGQVGYVTPVGPGFFLAQDVEFTPDGPSSHPEEAAELRAIADKIEGA